MLGDLLPVTDEILDTFQAPEGSINFYYGKIGNGKSYSATADILDLLQKGRKVYCNYPLDFKGFDERKSFKHLFFKILFFRDTFYSFPKENLVILDMDTLSPEFLSDLTDCDVFLDEGQWILDSYEGKNFSQLKRKLLLHTRHKCRSLNIISQRTQAVQVTARAQVNRFYKCEKLIEWPFLIFRRIEFQEMKDNDVNEFAEPVSQKVYFANKRVLSAYNTHYLRQGAEQKYPNVKAYRLSFKQRVQALLALFSLKAKQGTIRTVSGTTISSNTLKGEARPLT